MTPYTGIGVIGRRVEDHVLGMIDREAEDYVLGVLGSFARSIMMRKGSLALTSSGEPKTTSSGCFLESREWEMLPIYTWQQNFMFGDFKCCKKQHFDREQRNK